MRGIVRRVAEGILTASGLPGRLRLRHRHDAVILAYHNVTPDGEPPGGDRSLHLPVSRFVEQIERIARTHELVPLADLFRPGAKKPVRPRAVITFDDAYLGALQVGIPELTRRGIPATIFVAPGLLGHRTFWWDRLADPRSGAVPTPIREGALGECRGREDEILARFPPSLEAGRELPWSLRSGTEGELTSALSEAGITPGSHTWSHPNLATLARDEVREELRRARDWIDERFPGHPRCMAYPYGLRSPEAVSVVEELGECGLTLDGGLAGVAESVTATIPRINIPAGLSLRGLELRACGWVRS